MRRFLFFAVFIVALALVTINLPMVKQAHAEEVKTVATHQAVFVIGESKYTMDGKAFTMDAKTFETQGRTLVPVRYLGYALGVTPEDVTWDNTSGTATLQLGDMKLALALNSNELDKNGEKITMDVAPLLQNDRTYLPARFVAEAFGYEVAWDAYTNAVLVGPPGKLPLPPGVDIGDGKPAGRVEKMIDGGGGTDTTKPDGEPIPWVNE